MFMKDTTGDGRLDTELHDTTGDGRANTATRVLNPDFIRASSNARMRSFGAELERAQAAKAAAEAEARDFERVKARLLREAAELQRAKAANDAARAAANQQRKSGAAGPATNRRDSPRHSEDRSGRRRKTKTGHKQSDETPARRRGPRGSAAQEAWASPAQATPEAALRFSHNRTTPRPRSNPLTVEGTHSFAPGATPLREEWDREEAIFGTAAPKGLDPIDLTRIIEESLADHSAAVFKATHDAVKAQLAEYSAQSGDGESARDRARAQREWYAQVAAIEAEHEEMARRSKLPEPLPLPAVERHLAAGPAEHTAEPPAPVAGRDPALAHGPSAPTTGGAEGPAATVVGPARNKTQRAGVASLESKEFVFVATRNAPSSTPRILDVVAGARYALIRMQKNSTGTEYWLMRPATGGESKWVKAGTGLMTSVDPLFTGERVPRHPVTGPLPTPRSTFYLRHHPNPRIASAARAQYGPGPAVERVATIPAGKRARNHLVPRASVVAQGSEAIRRDDPARRVRTEGRQAKAEGAVHGAAVARRLTEVTV